MSLYVSLNTGDPLPDSDDVSIYCSPDKYDHGRCEPKVEAFMKNPLHDDLSVNRLQHFQLLDKCKAVECIIQEFIAYEYTLKVRGRFVVFNVGDAKSAVLNSRGCKLDFRYTPNPPLWSHSSIFDLPDDYDDERAVATALKRLITRSDTYHALP